MQAIKKLFQIITAFSRYYPGINRLHNFFQENLNHADEKEINGIHLTFEKNGLYENFSYKKV